MILASVVCLIFIGCTWLACKAVVKYHYPRIPVRIQQQNGQIVSLIKENQNLIEISEEKSKLINSMESEIKRLKRKLTTND